MGTEERRERERSARYETIVASARELFFAKGFTTTTMDEIAQQAELSKGSLYLHFPSKEALYATVMNEGLAILFDRLEAAFQLDLPPDQMLRRFGEVHYRYYVDYREYSRIFFFREHRDVTKLLPRELIQDNLEKARRCLQRIIEVIQQGVDKDIFAAVDSRQAAIAFWGATNGILFLFEDELNKELFGLNVEPLFFYTIDLFIGALKKR
jgi:AcrR family transcriptional regulator